MNTVYLIRHGATEGNLARRYIGCTDEPLNGTGREQAHAARDLMPECGALFSSPLSRAVESARIMFPSLTPVLLEDLRECDFGDFVGRKLDDLQTDPVFMAWVESGCRDPVPGGEDMDAFAERSVSALTGAMKGVPEGVPVCFMTHGASVMAILDRFGCNTHGFFDFYPRNCEFVKCDWDGEKLAFVGDNIC